MKREGFTFILIVCQISLFINGACQPTVKYWVAFTNKNNSVFSIANPEKFLSVRSIERRTRQGIAITESDLPITSDYIDSLQRMGFKIINTSKWFNGVVFEVNDSMLLDSLKKISFIKLPVIRLTAETPNSSAIKKPQSGLQNTSQEPDYGYSENHIRMLNGQYLHEKGFTGSDILIGVLDVGFLNANILTSLRHLWDEDRIVAAVDFVKDSLPFYQNYSHGTHVLGVMAGYLDQVVYGTAIGASYALLRTEVGAYEYLVEEYNWLCGAEFADSLGVDVINSSLGYSIFWDTLQNHPYADLDGKTTPISIAATMAAEKGILVVTSAGNEGSHPWHYITAPGDADKVLTVGAVDPDGFIAGFSSWGPSSDGRVKPDVCAQGVQANIQFVNGNIDGFSGTSCASPIIAGLSACLWQANQMATNQQIIQAIINSSSGYINPDDHYGYGIPDFGKADMIVKHMVNSGMNQLISFNLFPNPTIGNINLEVFFRESYIGDNITISIFDLMGRELLKELHAIVDIYSTYELTGINPYPRGIYIVQIGLSGQVYYLLFLKNG